MFQRSRITDCRMEIFYGKFFTGARSFQSKRVRSSPMKTDTKIKIKLIQICILTGALLGCVTGGKGKKENCSAPLSNENIEKIISREIDLSIPHTTEIKLVDCKYHIFIFPKNSPPDSHVFLLIDAKGNVIKKESGA